MMSVGYFEKDCNAVYSAIVTLLVCIKEPLTIELAKINGTPSTEMQVGKIDVRILDLDITLDIVNQFNTSGNDTSLDLLVPVDAIYKLSTIILCERFTVQDCDLDREPMYPCFAQPARAWLEEFFESLRCDVITSQNSPDRAWLEEFFESLPCDVITSQGESSQTGIRLVFSLNDIYVDDDY
jgi:hypothetical protein